MGSLLLIFIVFCVVLLCVFTFCVPCCGDRYDFRIKRCSVRLCLQLFVEGLMSYLRYLYLLAHSGVQHILYCGFALFVFVLLPVPLDCPFLIAPSVFSNVFFLLSPSLYVFRYSNFHTFFSL